jgi:hypothetical protein
MTEPRSRRRRWLRRAMIALGVLVVARVALALAMPWLVAYAARSQGFACTYQELDLSLLGGCVELWHLRLHRDGEDGGEPLAHVEYATVDLDVSALLLGRLRLHRAEVDGLDLVIERDAEGRFAWPSAASTTEPEPAQSAAEPAPIDLRPPIEIAALRAQHVRVRFRDASVQPVFEATIDASLRVSDLGAAEGGTRAELAVFSPELVDALRIEARGGSMVQTLQGWVTLTVAGLRPAPLAAYGLDSKAQRIDLDLRAAADLRWRDPTGLALDGTLAVSELRARVDGEEALRGEELALQIDELAPGVAAGTLALRVAAPGTFERLALAGSLATRGARTTFDLAAELAAGPSQGLPRWLADAGLELDLAAQPLRAQLAGELAATGSGLPNGQVRAEVRAADLIQVLELEANARGPEIDATLRGRGVTLAAARALFARSGLQPELAAGTFEANLRGRLDANGTSLILRDLRLADGERDLVTLGEAALVLAPGEAHIARAILRDAALDAHRRADGAMLIAGLRLVPVRATAAASTTAAEAHTAPAPTLRCDALAIERATLRWRDDTASLASAAVLDASCERLVLGADAPPAPFVVALRIPDSLEELALRGEIRSARDALALRAELDARGLRTGPLARYLPPGQSATLRDGRLRLAVDAALSGGSAKVEVRGLDFRDGEAPLARIERIAFDAPQLGSAAVAIDELSITGVTLRGQSDAEGAVELLGMRFAPGEVPPGAPPQPTEASSTAPGAPADAPADVRLARLDVQIAELLWQEHGARTPLRASLRLFNPQPLHLLSADPPSLEPLALRLEGAALPVARSLALALRATPFGAEPEVSGELAIDGIDGNGLLEALPALAARVKPGAMRDGTLRARLESHLRVRRRTPTDLGLAQGFGLEVSLDGVELRDRPDGALLAGLEALHVDVARIAPDTGDVHVRSIELVTPAATFTQQAEGLHAFGFVLPASHPEAPPPAEPAPATATVEQNPPPPLLRIDEFVVSGIDLRYEDARVTPPFRAPLTGLDVEVRGLTSLATREERPIDFRASVAAGPVEMPQRQYQSLLGGFLGAAAKAIGGADEQHSLEQRRLFDEIAVQGRVSLFPAPEGRIKTSITGLELLGLRGLAQTGGVEIGDGVLDAGIDLRLQGERGIAVDSRFVFQYLSLDEPADGPISRYLRLPAPLDTVLFVLRNDQGEHDIPLGFTVTESGVGGGQIAAAAATALGGLITDAIASSPFRITGAFTDLTGLTGGGPAEQREESLPLLFAPFETALTIAQRNVLAPLAERLADDETLVLVVQHELGGGDIERAQRVANPDPAHVRSLVARLRARKAELERERAARAAEAAIQHALGSVSVSEARSALENVETRLGQVEIGLDRALELLRPGAERRAERRMREACAALGQLRLANIRRSLEELGAARAIDRIELRKPRFVPSKGTNGGRALITVKVRAQ